MELHNSQGVKTLRLFQFFHGLLGPTEKDFGDGDMKESKNLGVDHRNRQVRKDVEIASQGSEMMVPKQRNKQLM